MGYIQTKLKLSNAQDTSLRPVEVEALVDTGAITLCIPEHIAVQLKLTEIDKREVTITDGRTQVVSYVGPVRVDFENRTSFTGALVLGDWVLMGVVLLEDMDLVLNPVQQTVTVNPASPNIPHVLVKKV
ncbi:MAG: clan AA aspartic protease [Calditrichaeota bacterium]|nr:clan AA aspartic protease [Calditrichota bacterium]